MAEQTKRRAAKQPAEAPDDPSGAVSLSFGDEQRKRASELEPPDADADLHERIAWILANIPDVPKLGHAEVRMKTGGSYTYDYVKEADLMNAVRPLLGRAKVAAYPSIEDVTQHGEVAVTIMRLTFVHRELREEIKIKVAGTDKGDRAMVKALTTGMRYLLQKQFQIATDGIDPERENIERGGEPELPADPPRPARPRRASGKPTDTITPQQRGTIYQHARSLFIADERVRAILDYASEGKITSSDKIQTVEQLDWAYRQLDRYAADPDAGEAKLAEAGVDVADRTKDADEKSYLDGLSPEELAALNEPDKEF